jgi:hypothetical protein
LTDWEDYQDISKAMKVDTAKQLLQKVCLIGATTPHRLSRHLRGEGNLICSDIHNFIVDQPASYEHTAICLSECYVMEIEYEVYRHAIDHLNSDEEKQFI